MSVQNSTPADARNRATLNTARDSFRRIQEDLVENTTRAVRFGSEHEVSNDWVFERISTRQKLRLPTFPSRVDQKPLPFEYVE